MNPEEMSNTILKLPLFQGFGIELEYMIVDKETLDVKPLTDQVLFQFAGKYLNEIERGEMSLSNELALHVIEFKTTNPKKTLTFLENPFLDQVREVNAILEPMRAALMPTGMHPWMDPFQEMVLWPHEQNPIYEQFHRIFDCRGHGWANLQSSHLNLAFSNDHEFAKLHSSIRVLLPLLPALSASSPFIDGVASGYLDTRLKVYNENSKKLPSITGQVIPEPILSQKEYVGTILERMYGEIRPHDPENILQYEWLNSRGAIARFDRFTIEIRLLDTQECPAADLAIIQLIIASLKALHDEEWVSHEKLFAIEQKTLVEIYKKVVKEGEFAIISDLEYLRLFGVEKSLSAKELWQKIYEKVESRMDLSKPVWNALQVILQEGSLSTRILRAWKRGGETKASLREIYRSLCHHLNHGDSFK